MTSAGLPEFMQGVVDKDPSTWPQCKTGEIWEVGKHLDEDYPTPSDDMMCELWQTHMGVPAVSTKSIFGVYTPPERPIKAVASVDLCEMVRDTRKALYAATKVPLPTGAWSADYSAGTWYDKSLGNCRERSVVVSMLRVLMNAGYVSPVEGSAEIADTLGHWRESGVWVVANTSTLPGCEPGTIKHTLAESMNAQFDGLVLPRNHNGTGTLTKASALRQIIREAGITGVPVMHIDDAPYHHDGFRAEQDLFDDKIYLLGATYGAACDSLDYSFETPLDTFRGANALFKYLGVVK